ncbi:branched-chain amino acid transport system II carrier protein [Pseudomonas sp. F1_0610]|uniref:branched-chain amino acid transport system II carrier protein n=1 Tax=Pseudomonas sp. F1_0610 TaxID=3114284 RepID=UPI0039C31188
MKRLSSFELLALGFMTFALFLGAGNIIMPALIGMQAGAQAWPASIGFLISAVSLPLLAVVALGRVGGGLISLASPLGRFVAVCFAVAVYLAIGPLFATPRTAAVSFEIGLTPFLKFLPGVDQSCLVSEECYKPVASTALWGYSTLYFAIVLFLALRPSKIVDNLGKIMTPVLLLGLIVLGGTAMFLPAGEMGPVQAEYSKVPMVKGFLEGYLTMDALAALVFGLVIANAIRSKGITDQKLITRYSIYAGLMAAVGLSLVYLTLIYLGAGSYDLVKDIPDINGGLILAKYVEHTFGDVGNSLLALVIVLACLTTAVGLITACAEFFNDLTDIPYWVIASVFTTFSWLISNVGLSQLLELSIPVLYGLYPLAIALILLALSSKLWNYPSIVFIPVMYVTFIFGLVDGLNAAKLNAYVPAMFDGLFGVDMQMAWVLPAVFTLCSAIVLDRYAPQAIKHIAQQIKS